MSGDLVVTGGPGGVVARVTDLEAAAGALDRVAARLDVAAGALARALAAAEPPAVPAALPVLAEAWSPLLHGPRSLPGVRDELADVAARLRRAAGGYREAEDAAGLLVRAVETTLTVGARWVHGLVTSGTPLRPGVLSGDAVPAGVAAGAVPADPVAGLAALVAVLPRATTAGRRVVTTAGPPRTVPAPRDEGDVMRLVRDTAAVDSRVSVTRLDHPDGSRSWVVAIPGTQELAPGGDDPLDMEGNLQLVAGQWSDSADLAWQAMRAAGIGAGEPVLLAGHSQGGMVAAALAGSAAVTAAFAIGHVVTAGSPVARLPARPGVRSLHVAHTTDVVPALDGARNPDTPASITVTRDLAASADPADRAAARGQTGSHGSDTYARTLERVGTDDHPSLREWRASTARVYGEPGTVATRVDVVGRRAG